jgi:dipeptidyl aminopeptidase/acylaminoacyl peptidase
MMHHGTADETCPFPWAATTQRLLEQAGADSRLEVYRGEHHSFVPQWQASIERSVRFIRRQFAA